MDGEVYEVGEKNGSVANGESGEATVCIALSDPADLYLADGMYRLGAIDRSARTVHRWESGARCNPLLDELVVLLDDVVQIRRRSATTAMTQFTGLL